MQRIFWPTILSLLVANPVGANDPRATELVGLMTMAVRNATEHLQLVRHSQGAQWAADPLARLDRYLAFMLAEDKRVKIGDAHPDAIKLYERAVDELAPEWKRVEAEEQLKYVLNRMPAFRRVLTERTGGKPSVAAQDVQTLTKAAQAFEIRYGQLPERLEQLAAPPDGGNPFVDRDALTDPWGRPYKYDPAGPRNAGVRPDIWSLGPDPNDPKGVIGNWPATPEAKDGTMSKGTRGRATATASP